MATANTPNPAYVTVVVQPGATVVIPVHGHVRSTYPHALPQRSSTALTVIRKVLAILGPLASAAAGLWWRVNQ